MKIQLFVLLLFYSMVFIELATLADARVATSHHMHQVWIYLKYRYLVDIRTNHLLYYCSIPRSTRKSNDEDNELNWERNSMGCNSRTLNVIWSIYIFHYINFERLAQVLSINIVAYLFTTVLFTNELFDVRSQSFIRQVFSRVCHVRWTILQM